MRCNRLDSSVASGNNHPLVLRRNEALPVRLLETKVRHVVPGTLENTADLATGSFPAKGVCIVDKGNFHILMDRTKTLLYYEPKSKVIGFLEVWICAF